MVKPKTEYDCFDIPIVQISVNKEVAKMATKRLNGEGSWGTKTISGKKYVRFRKIYDGKAKEFYGKNQSDVKKKIKSYEKALKISKDDDIRKQSIGSYMLDWLNNVRVNKVAPNTFTTDYKTYHCYIENSDFAKLQIGCITSDSFQLYMDGLTEKYARNTYKKIYLLYKLTYRYACKHGAVNINPCLDTELPTEKTTKIKRKRYPLLSVEDIESIYNEAFRMNTDDCHITGPTGTRVYSVNILGIPLILYTGVRSSELTAIQWKHVDFENKRLSILQAWQCETDPLTGKQKDVLGEPKYGSVRIIPLADKAITILNEIKRLSTHTDPDDFVITCKAHSLYKPFQRMLKRCDCSVDQYSLHWARHAFGSMLLTQHIDLKTISMLMGHRDIKTTANVYLDVSPQLATEAIDAVNFLNKLNS